MEFEIYFFNKNELCTNYLVRQLHDIFSLYSSYLNSMRTAIIYERSSSDYKKNKTVIDKNYDNAYKKYNNVLESIQQFLSLLENS